MTSIAMAGGFTELANLKKVSVTQQTLTLSRDFGIDKFGRILDFREWDNTGIHLYSLALTGRTQRSYGALIKNHRLSAHGHQ